MSVNEIRSPLRLTKRNAISMRYYASDTAVDILDGVKLVGLKDVGHKIVPGAILPTRDGPFVVNKVMFRGNDVYDLSSMETSDASIFLIPMIAPTRAALMWDIYYMNTFIWDEDDQTASIRILLRSGPTDRYKELDTKLKEHPNFLRMEKKDDFTNMYIFTVPEKWDEDFLKIMRGQYSQLSDEYKIRIVDFHSIRKNHEVYGILYKTGRRRKKVEEVIGQDLMDHEELYHVLNSDRETYYNKYKVPDNWEML